MGRVLRAARPRPRRRAGARVRARPRHPAVTLRARRLGEPAAFLEAAGPLLLADEARHNVILGLAATLLEHPARYPEHRLWIVEDGGAVVGAALQTPPHALAVAQPAAGGALDVLAEAIDGDLPGVSGAVPEAERFAAAWSRRTGRTPHVDTHMGLYRLERLVPATAAGAPRTAGERDRALLCRWWSAFLLEAEGHDADDVAASVELRLAADGWGIELWEDGGVPVSMAAFGNPTPNGVRIGPVYTPPELRGRGYASALVADVSQRLLDRGRRFCFLYADHANPTATGIYRRIGYEHVCDAVNVSFE